MIRNRKELLDYLLADEERFAKTPSIIDYVLHNEKWYIYHYLRHLRFVEYYQYKLNGGGKFWLIPYYYHWLRWKRLGFKLRFTIYPNTCGPGLIIYHTGDFVHVGKNVHIGKNCTLLSGVVFSSKSSNDEVWVGDNCRFGLGVRIFGAVKIGSNVTIGANAVITKDLPDNCVAAGVPAKVIRTL